MGEKLEFSEKEIKMLNILFNMGDSIFNYRNSLYLDNGEYFDGNDLFALKEKILGSEYD